MRGAVRIDPSGDCEGSDDAGNGGDFDGETAVTPDHTPPSSTKESTQEPAARSDYLPQTTSKVCRSQSLDLGKQQSNRCRKERPSRRASVNSVGIFPSASIRLDEAERDGSAESATDSAMESKNRTRRMLKAINQASHEVNREGRRVLRFIRKTFRGRRNEKETSVKEIHINPEGDLDRWASRSASATSTTTSSTSSNSNHKYLGPNDTDISTSSPHVVHDINEEFPSLPQNYS